MGRPEEPKWQRAIHLLGYMMGTQCIQYYMGFLMKTQWGYLGMD